MRKFYAFYAKIWRSVSHQVALSNFLFHCLRPQRTSHLLWVEVLLFFIFFPLIRSFCSHHFPPQAIHMCSELWRKKLYPHSQIHSWPFTHTSRHAKTKCHYYACRHQCGHTDVVTMHLKKCSSAGLRAVVVAMSKLWSCSFAKQQQQLCMFATTLMSTVKMAKIFMAVISYIYRPLLSPFSHLPLWHLAHALLKTQLQMLLIKTTSSHQMKTHIFLQSVHFTDYKCRIGYVTPTQLFSSLYLLTKSL